MLAAQAGVLHGVAGTIGTVTACAGGDLPVGHAATVNALTQGDQLFVVGKAGLDFLGGGPKGDVLHVGIAQLGSKALHDGVFTNAGLELLQLLDQVFRMLLGQLRIDRSAGIAVSAVAGCARCCELGFASHKIGLDDLGRRSWCCWRGGMRRQSRRR